jgi:phytoene dehydrogenase-like protein
MAEIPRQLASELPSHCVRLDCRVASIDRGSNGEVCGVTLDTGESFEASAVVVATDGVTAQRLSGTKTVEGFSTSVCLYFASDEPLVHGKYIVLNGSGKGMVQEVVPVTNVAPQHAPSGRHLTSVTLLGSHDIPDDQLAQSVMKEIAAWFPEADLKSFELLKVYRITHHQFKQGVGYRRELPKISTDVPGLYFAGEFTTNSSIDGAVESGLRCASILLKG